MAKKKSKLKKILKAAVPMLAVAGLGKAFMDARNRKDMINSATADDGFSLPFSRPNMRNIAGELFVKPKMMTPEDMANDEMFLGAMAKKGGRIKKTKKGGRAVRKANRSKKK